MSNPARRRASHTDLETLPDTVVGEILDGELHAAPRPALLHAAFSSDLGGLLQGPFRFGRGGPGGWWLIDEPELHLDDDVLVPDLAGWRRERVPALPAAAAMTLAPDWICEVLSPSTGRIDRVIKMPIYAAKGVKHAWLVDPPQRTIEVYRLTKSGQYLCVVAVDGTVPVRLEPFEAVELELGLLWPTPAAE